MWRLAQPQRPRIVKSSLVAHRDFVRWVFHLQISRNSSLSRDLRFKMRGRNSSLRRPSSTASEYRSAQCWTCDSGKRSLNTSDLRHAGRPKCTSLQVRRPAPDQTYVPGRAREVFRQGRVSRPFGLPVAANPAGRYRRVEQLRQALPRGATPLVSEILGSGVRPRAMLHLHSQAYREICMALEHTARLREAVDLAGR